ncbi:hypothetical protein [Pelosinus sp. UFO1]|uniref:lysine 5,6-aminomutase reactivase subunit KamB n=1 Tax=Pelosinus sp. UFO1 TaxID=484770 RepID=UPI001F451189|nr:hypothetical protein [Pelosinus sp. UFO1]
MENIPRTLRIKEMLTWSDFCGVPPSVVTIVGMAKNVGKTVTLNYIQRVLYNQGLILGLTSIGRDGESFDALTNISKPSIVVQPQAIVATAEKVVANPNLWDYLQKTDIVTPLGNVVILRAKAVSKVVLAGPSKNQEVKRLLQYLSGFGTNCILIDGAFDRQSSADPLVSNQVVLASGATLSRDLEQLIYITKSRVEQLTLPKCDDFYLTLCKQSKSKVVLAGNSGLREIVADTSLLSTTEWAKLLCDDCSVVLIKGAVGDGLAHALLEKRHTPAVIVQDGSKIFITPFLWRQLKVRNVKFQVVQPISLLGVTINPSYPGGNGFDPDVLLQGMGKALAPLPIIDVVREVKF